MNSFRKNPILTLVIFPFALMGVVIIRLVKPLIRIRFGRIIASRLGHYSLNIELYLCKRDQEREDGKRTFDILVEVPPRCNDKLKEMWYRSFKRYPSTRMIQSVFFEWIHKLNLYFPGFTDHLAPIREDRDFEGLLPKTKPHIVLTPEERCLGEQMLRKIGIQEKNPSFVGFFVRDSSYLETLFPDIDYSYHNYRNSNIADMVPAVEELARRGHYAVRLGSHVKEALPAINPKIIDYATNGRSEFMDIFLAAHCRFYLGTASGPASLTTIFRVPIASTNHTPLEFPPFGESDIFIPKKIWSVRENRFLTFSEILDMQAGKFLREAWYIQHGLQLINSTPQEITDVALEMDERLKGTWRETSEDQALQDRFWACFQKRSLPFPKKARIGARFLSQNSCLLE